MKIIITTTIYPPDIGGPATYAYEFQKRMTKAGHEVTIVTTSKKTKSSDVIVKPSKLNIKVIGFIVHQFELFITLFRLLNGSDMIYSLDPKFLGLNSLCVCRLRRKPFIVRFSGDAVWESAFKSKITDKTPEDFYKNFNVGYYLKFVFHLQRFVLNRADKIIVNSKSMKKIAHNFYKVFKPKMKVVYNSIEIKDIVKDNKNLNKKNNIEILSLGRLTNFHRVDMVIKAVANINKDYPKIRLKIAGEGPERDYLEKLTDDTETKNISFIGYVELANLPEIYSKTDILVHNTVFDVFPHVLVESMSYKTPIITSSDGGAREIVFDGETGLIAQSGNQKDLERKIIKLITNQDLRNSIVENAYNNIKKNFTWKTNLPLLEKELEELI